MADICCCVCSEPNAIGRCSECKVANYCSKECQEQDWNTLVHWEFCGARARYNREKVAYVMREFSKGRLHDSHGNVVTDRKQALAIAYSEARRKA